eukprot:scaffold105688_cov32-Tisochrysis_lutea.AAC.4
MAYGWWHDGREASRRPHHPRLATLSMAHPGKHEPDQEKQLRLEHTGRILQRGQKCKDEPVGEPLPVIIAARCFEGPYGFQAAVSARGGARAESHLAGIACMWCRRRLARATARAALPV